MRNLTKGVATTQSVNTGEGKATRLSLLVDHGVLSVDRAYSKMPITVCFVLLEATSQEGSRCICFESEAEDEAYHRNERPGKVSGDALPQATGGENYGTRTRRAYEEKSFTNSVFEVIHS